MFDGVSFDPFSLFDNVLCSAEVGIGRCHIVQALVITFDFALSLRRQWHNPNMVLALRMDIDGGQLTDDIAGSVAEQPRFVAEDMGAITA